MNQDELKKAVGSGCVGSSNRQVLAVGTGSTRDFFVDALAAAAFMLPAARVEFGKNQSQAGRAGHRLLALNDV